MCMPPRSLLFSAALALLFLLSCAQESAEDSDPAGNGQRSEASAASGISDSDSLKPIAIVQSHPSAAGEFFWFELAEGGPRLIASPGYAEIVPFIPWKLSRHIAAFIYGSDNRLYAAVNREGFIAFEDRGGGETALYNYPDREWAFFSLASVFRDAGSPSVLLTRDEIFSPETPLPLYPIRSWNGSGFESPQPGVLSAWKREDGWIPDELFLGGDNYWYIRVKNNGNREIICLKSASLGESGEKISDEKLLAAFNPLPADKAPPALANLLQKLASSPAGRAAVVCTVIAGADACRYYRLGASAGDEPEQLFACVSETQAALLLPDSGKAAAEGAAVYFGGSDTSAGALALPDLDERFSYTAVAIAGDSLIVGWEERQGSWTVGSAGFLLVELEMNGGI